MDAEQRDEFLRSEYFSLQASYEDFDRRTLTIKGWSVTIALAGLALGFQSGQPAVWLLAAAAGLLFWGLESLWKFFQYCFSVRIQLLESYFRGEEEVVPDPLQIHTSWFDAFNESESWTREILGNAFLAPVIFPHAVAVAAGIALFVIQQFYPMV